MPIHKYRLYCETEGISHLVISDGPTQCPVDPLHTIRLPSVSIVECNVDHFDGTPVELGLTLYKELRYREIDKRTEELISMGFDYDGETFSLSKSAQSNWLALHSSPPSYVWPKEISTIDDGSYVLAEADLEAFWNAQITRLWTECLDAGRDIKESITAATTESEVDAIIDTRT